MTKTEFIDKLNKGLGKLSKEDREKIIEYYEELLYDKTENGIDEETAVAELEPIDQIIAKYKAEYQGSYNVALGILDAFLLVIVLICVAVVLISLTASAIGCIGLGIVVITKNINTFLASFGIGLFCLGILFLITKPCFKLIKRLYNNTKEAKR